MHNNKQIILIDKHKDITSFDVIRILRKLTNMRKIGHAGTLDPNATGLMILGVGKGTKLLNTFIKLPKVYKAEVMLGIKTESADIDSNVLIKSTISKLQEDTVRQAVESLIGIQYLSVPKFSAIKVKGKRLYKYARENKPVKLPNKKMEVKQANLITYSHPLLTVEFDVSSGTYIRSLAEEIGRKLQTYATLSNLRRLSIGDFQIKDSWKIKTPKQQEAFSKWFND